MLKASTLKLSVLFAAVLTLSSLALAQNQNQQNPVAEVSSPAATTACNVTFSSGTSTNATQFCVTVNGNIAQFSVAGGELIAVNGVGEGYAICDSRDSASYYDFAYAASPNWLSPTFTHSGNVVTITRQTNDGIWQLTQTITNVPATATGPGAVKISMALKNLSNENRGAFILRYVDVNADGDRTGNDFDYTLQTAYGLKSHAGQGRGLSSTNNTFNPIFGQQAYTQNAPGGPNPCAAFASIAPQPFHGDGSIVQIWSVPAGGHNSSHTVVSTYRPI
jgi:hypothetical protein